MCDASDTTLLLGVTLPGPRLLVQASHLISLAEADEPELSACGWSALRTESLRRLTRDLTTLLADAPSAEAPEATRLYDATRRARDLLETLDVYGSLMARAWWSPVCCALNPADLPALVEAIRRAQSQLDQHLDGLLAEGLHPMVPQRLKMERAACEWAAAEQRRLGGGLTSAGRRVASLKGRIHAELVRLNRLGGLAYRQDSTHQARYNLDILDCRQPALTAPLLDALPGGRAHAAEADAAQAT